VDPYVLQAAAPRVLVGRREPARSTGAAGSLPAAQALALWVASPPHLAILLTPGWKQVGIGAVAAPDAGGVYDGASVLIVAADFGAR
jgi:hypothetical protein